MIEIHWDLPFIAIKGIKRAHGSFCKLSLVLSYSQSLYCVFIGVGVENYYGTMCRLDCQHKYTTTQ